MSKFSATIKKPKLPKGIAKVPFIVIALIMVIFPLVFLVSNSLKPNIEMFHTPRLFPTRIDTSHFVTVFASGRGTLRHIWNSVHVTLITTAVSVSLGSLAAYALNKLKVRRIVAVITVLIVLVRFYPKITIVIPYFLIMSRLNLLDSTIGIIIAHVGITIPVVVLIMQTFFRSVPKELEEAAYVDGARTAQAFFRVVLPVVKSGLAASALLVAMVSWNEFLLASSIASRNSMTLPIVVAGFVTDRGIDWGAMAALSVVTVIPIMIIVLVFQKYLIKGLTSGSVKG